MKMTEDEAIAQLRHYAPHLRVDYTEAIRTVCDTLEAQRRAVPIYRESHIALREAYATNSEEDYFSARHSSLDMASNRHIFNAGFTRGFDTAVERYAAAPAQPAPDKYAPCLNSLVRQVALMMEDCEEHADGRVTIDNDISQGFLRRIYDLLNVLEDCGYDAMEAHPAPETAGDARDVVTEAMLVAALKEADPLGSLVDWDESKDCVTRPQMRRILEAAILAKGDAT
jgi:hypothetical protein